MCFHQFQMVRLLAPSDDVRKNAMNVGETIK